MDNVLRVTTCIRNKCFHPQPQHHPANRLLMLIRTKWQTLRLLRSQIVPVLFFFLMQKCFYHYIYACDRLKSLANHERWRMPKKLCAIAFSFGSTPQSGRGSCSWLKKAKGQSAVFKSNEHIYGPKPSPNINVVQFS